MRQPGPWRCGWDVTGGLVRGRSGPRPAATLTPDPTNQPPVTDHPWWGRPSQGAASAALTLPTFLWRQAREKATRIGPVLTSHFLCVIPLLGRPRSAANTALPLWAAKFRMCPGRKGHPPNSYPHHNGLGFEYEHFQPHLAGVHRENGHRRGVQSREVGRPLVVWAADGSCPQPGYK